MKTPLPFLPPLLALLAMPLRAEEPAPAFPAVFKILDERCLECHAQEDYEGGLVLENFQTLMKGGESGAAIKPGKSGESLLIQYLHGDVVKDGKKKIMPPGKRKKLEPEEIALIAKWIDAGAQPPLAGAEKPRELKVAKITPKVAPRNSIAALAFSEKAKLLAVGRFQTIELISPETRAVARRLEGHHGNVNALAFSPDGSQLFSASGENALFGEVKQWNVADGKPVRTIQGHRDTIYSLAISPDGKTLATGSYDQQIKLWNVATGAEIRTLRGHNGAVYGLAFRPDGKILASASADRTLKLWEVATGQRRDTLSQSLKDLYTVAWSADGKRVAAAGVDNRIRVWEVSAEARETTNPMVYARFAHEAPILKIAWSADGATLLSAAQDQNVKLWNAAEMNERLLLEKQPDWVAALAFANGGKTVVAGRQDGTLAFYDAKSGAKIERPVVSTLVSSDAAKPGDAAAIASGAKPAAAKPMAKPALAKPPGKPLAVRLEPRGIQRGGTAKVKLLGSNLAGLKFVAVAEPAINVQFADGANGGEALLTISTPPNLKRGAYEISVVGSDAHNAGIVKLLVDDLPQIYERKREAGHLEKLPASIWGALDKPGDADRLEFDAKAGQTLVFDLAAKSLGSKADAVLSLLDSAGKVLASNNDYDGTGDPLLAHTFSKAGRYTLVVSDAQFGGSAEHFFRLSAGELPFVTASFPPSIAANRESEIELIGFNLPAERKVKVTAGATGEMAVPLDPERARSRRGLKALVSELPQFAEAEPNDRPEQATRVQAPCSIAGRIQGPGDPANAIASGPPQLPAGSKVSRFEQRHVTQVPEVSPHAPVVPGGNPGATTGKSDVDVFRFEAKAGSVWAIETQAAQRGSPVDTKIEVLHPDGKPVERLLLQAVRDSAVTFRPIDSAISDVRVDNWQEMELRQLMYLNGEVAKIFRMPEGPDSGFQFFATGGKREAYFDTTPIAHALDEPCYIVEPHPPGAKLTANGLPVFTLFYANDDSADRKLGIDSRLLFTAPADGAFLVRVSDSRGLSGDRFVYRLVIREAKHDFAVRLNGANLAVPAGSGQEFDLFADRKDGFDGDITVDFSGVPEGFKVAGPLVIQAGHDLARATLNALPGAKADADWSKVKVSATALIAGKKETREVNNFGAVKLAPEPKVFVALEPAAAGDSMKKVSAPVPLRPQDTAKPFEITIAPGETIPAWVKVKRNGFMTELRFDVQNLPHGVIVDNLGLSGITLLTGQNEGEIFLRAAPWVEDLDRLCFVAARDAGKQTSLPVLLHVRKKAELKTVSAK